MISLVQSASNAGASPTFPIPVTKGNLIVALLGFNGSSSVLTSSLTDNATPSTNVYQVASPINGNSALGEATAIYYSWNIHGNTALTLSATSTAGFYQFDAAEFSGVQNTGNPLQTHNEAQAASGTGYQNCCPVTTSVLGELIISINDWSSGAMIPLAPWMAINPLVNMFVSADPNSYSFLSTNHGSDAWTVNTAAFLPQNVAVSPEDMTPGTCVMWRKI